MCVGLQDLDRSRRADGPLDADHRSLAERDADMEIVGERGLDDLFLNLTVEGHVDLLPLVILAHIDARVLLGELTSPDSWPLDRRPPLEDGQPRHLVRTAGPVPQPVANSHGSREHPHVTDLLAAAAAFDLED